jgi:hypothetical protein
VNVLALQGMALVDIVEGGARRISLGGGLTWIAVNAMADAARRILDDGDLSVLQARPPLDEWLA